MSAGTAENTDTNFVSRVVHEFSGIFWKGCVEKEVDFVVDTCDHDHVVYGQSFPYDKRRKIR